MTTEYLLTDIEFNKKYGKKKKLTKMMIRVGKKRKAKQERKLRQYQNRIPKKYAIYIKSKYWTKRKNRYYQEHKRECIICSSSKFCDLHHLAYRHEEFGNERDEDLVCLCRNCHEDYHLEFGVKGNMHDSFAEFCASRVNNPIFR
jgi:hypothetical protein